jgi:hypothetical protein
LAESDLILQHDLMLNADLPNGVLQVEDTLQLPTDKEKPSLFKFSLGKDFQLDSPKLSPLARNADAYTYQLNLTAPQTSIQLRYQAKLSSTPNCDWLHETCRLFDKQGIYLDANSGWYPRSANSLHRFRLHIKGLPSDWLSLSQGQAIAQGWQETQAQTSLYLIAGQFKSYQSKNKAFDTAVYLRQADEALAQQYLDASQQYLGEYSALLGQYPYNKFVVLESFWPTGWGMPSFTMLGSSVMRLPFIPHTSLPHEIVHNWWGNSVYVDAAQGNWSEGLTAYVADQRLKAQQGQGAEYRRDSLQKYATLVNQHNDFPLSQFRARHNDSSQAIGYDKSLMVFHMLHEQLGEQSFYAKLREFYKAYQFRYASFANVLDALGASAEFKQQWLYRTGAPQLAIQGATLQQTDKGYVSELSLAQTQASPAFSLNVPIVFSFADGSTQRHVVSFTQSQQRFKFALAQLPTQVAVDPAFDVLRIPDTAELPAALAALFTDEPKVIVMAKDANADLKAAWQQWAQTLKAEDARTIIQDDTQAIPANSTVIMLGGKNAMHEYLLQHIQQPKRLTDVSFTLNEAQYLCAEHSLAVAVRVDDGRTFILLDALDTKSWQTLLRKLPHYGKYSYVTFHAQNGNNLAKGQWPIQQSPLLLVYPPKATP